VLVIAERVKIEEIGDVNVLHAKLIRLAAIVNAARCVIVDFYPLHLEATVAVLDAPVKLCVSINEIHGRDVMSDKRENLFFRFLVHYRCSIRIVVLKLNVTRVSDVSDR
jgi:hypothetical protein